MQDTTKTTNAAVAKQAAEANATSVEFKLVSRNYILRHDCHICGGCTGKVEILCEYVSPENETFRICERCLKDREFDAKLIAYYEFILNYAEKIKGLIGRITAPTFEEWEAATKVAEEEYLRGE